MLLVRVVHLLVAVDKVGLEHSNQLEGHHEADGDQVVVENEESEEVEEKAFRRFVVSMRRLLQIPVGFSVLQLPVLDLIGSGGDEGDGDEDEEEENYLNICHFFNSTCFKWSLS